MSQTQSVASVTGGGRAGARTSRPGVALLVIATAQLMVVLDATIVYVALPHIQRGLGFSNSGLEWVVNAYALTFGGLLLLGGRAGDLLGRRSLFIAGLLLFSRLAGAAVAARLVSRVGARPLLVAGAAASAGGMYWLSRITEHSSYAGGLLGPSLIAGAGLGLLFVPLPIVGLSRVPECDSGVASSLLNTGRQVGGALGLGVLGTVAWTVTANRVRSGGDGLTGAAAYQHALAAGLDRAFLVAAGLAILILVTAIITIRSGKQHGAASS